MRIKLTYILFFGLIFQSSFIVAQKNDTSTKIEVLSTQANYDVGGKVILKFTSAETKTPLLYCSNSYGSTLVSATLKNNTLEYVIPENITKKIGIINWKLLDKSGVLSGKFYIQPKAEVATMETYIGPPSIEAGGTDYTMLVVIPTDSLDNPAPKNTLVTAKHQFLTSEEKDAIYTKNLIAYKNINSKKEDGRMLISSESLGKNSKEFTINVTAAIPTNFKITVSRPHKYADGNQVTTFSTSIIRDRYNNIISDGTFVTFFITNSKKNILKTTGTTIDGIANSKIIHPDYEDNWSIKAYVNGMAESNRITLNYIQVIKDFKVEFSENNRSITVGPLKSFMQQMIPNGLQVTLTIYKNGKNIETLTKTSFNGFVKYTFKPAVYENGTYNFSVKTAGKQKEFKTVKLW